MQRKALPRSGRIAEAMAQWLDGIEPLAADGDMGREGNVGHGEIPF